MIERRDSLAEALRDVEARTVSDVSTIVVSQPWWDSLSVNERNGFQNRAERAKVALRVDQYLSRHFVEIRGGEDGPPLSSERPM
jgi:hypothetical protein